MDFVQTFCFVLFDLKITKYVRNFQYITEIAGYRGAGYSNSKTLYEGGGVFWNIMIDDIGEKGGLEISQKVWHNIWTVPKYNTESYELHYCSINVFTSS